MGDSVCPLGRRSTACGPDQFRASSPPSTGEIPGHDSTWTGVLSTEMLGLVTDVIVGKRPHRVQSTETRPMGRGIAEHASAVGWFDVLRCSAEQAAWVNPAINSVSVKETTAPAAARAAGTRRLPCWWRRPSPECRAPAISCSAPALRPFTSSSVHRFLRHDVHGLKLYLDYLKS